jgi:hypothetical protein
MLSFQAGLAKGNFGTCRNLQGKMQGNKIDKE